MKVDLFNGECLEVMDKLIDDGVVVDAIITDPPYGTTACKWDSVIPFDEMWLRLNKLIKPNGAVVLFGSEPFSSALRMSNIKNYKYDWIWKKSRASGFTNAKLKPLKDVEVISVFSDGNTANGSENNMNYYPQGLLDCDKIYKRPSSNVTYNGVSPIRANSHKERIIKKENYPRQIIEFGVVHNVGLHHPTQKPVKLMEYLIKTYTNEDELVLDFTMGSGTTGVAAVQTGRNFMGIEMNKDYYEIAKDRINTSEYKEEVKKTQFKLF